ncbi:MAG: dockerin type I domain-containing protein [Candidatus Bathyarchaeota archaeon]|nr:dockerin type I domain-containing protein [Candidatus Bathyarchaeota archaeon]
MDDGYPSGGNYWSDHIDVDQHSGPYQNETGSDWICDYPYVINENNTDNYPLMGTWPPYEYDVTIEAHCNTEGIDVSVTILRLSENWILLAADPDEGNGTSLRAIYGQLYSGIIYFKVEHYRSWANISDIGTLIFMDADQNSSTGLPDGAPGQNTSIGADYLIVVGWSGTVMVRWNSTVGQWTNPIPLAYLDAPNGTIVFVVGVYLADVETTGVLDCAVAEPMSDWDWMPDTGHFTFTLDGSPTPYTTPHTFTGLKGTHTFTVPNTDPNGHTFKRWSTGETNTTITVTTGGTYTAYYGISDVAVTNVTFSKTVVGQGCCMNITVTVENQGNFTEWFGVVAPYFDGVVIPTSAQWETFWSMGDVNLDGYINQIDEDIIMDNLFWTGPPGGNPADINSDGSVDVADLWICAVNQGLDIWTHFGLPLPLIGTQRGVKLCVCVRTTLTFTWNATGFSCGNYTITAYANTVPGETETTDNTYTDGLVLVTVVGDVNGDGKVGAPDIIKVGDALFSIPGDSNYNPNADLNGDGKVGAPDIILIGDHLFESWP